VKFVISDLENIYRDVAHAHMNWKTKFHFFPAIFGRHLEYLEYPELPKGDMTTPTLGFLLTPYTIIIHREKNYIKKYGVQSLGSRTISRFAAIGVGQNSYSGTSLAGTVNKRFSTALTSLAAVSHKILVSFILKLPSLLKQYCYAA